ncbi:LysE/ArgO family amino acid transporter [Lacticaseibacillus hulanensis]|uniref:LysE/ArgO family amino acid transporter n=1 Tax=Lacticaseibacillus hulanensis TaxID=2493111 RepID=UPI000FDB4757|nr:LysE family transporter [Lacticaseibacillus hulanensis]
MLATYLHGMIISIALVTSIGMQNLFVFNNALGNKLRHSLLYALFVWIADTTLTVVAFLGMGALISSSTLLRLIVMSVGGAIVIWIGIGIIRSAHTAVLGDVREETTMKAAFIGAWVVAFANPQALIDTSLMLGALRGTLASWQVLPFLLGVITSTALWFFGITLVLGLLKNRLPQHLLMWVNIASGVIVTGYGAMLIYEVITTIF